MRKTLTYSAILSASIIFSTVTYAEEYTLTIKNHRFSPQELTIPAGRKIKIAVKNQDATPAEFESSDLDREKVVGANGEIIIFVGPLDAGTYGYFDDFHHDTTTGTIIAK
jgi:plastocyanin